MGCMSSLTLTRIGVGCGSESGSEGSGTCWTVWVSPLFEAIDWVKCCPCRWEGWIDTALIGAGDDGL